jgi:hypothetical protein
LTVAPWVHHANPVLHAMLRPRVPPTIALADNVAQPGERDIRVHACQTRMTGSSLFCRS